MELISNYYFNEPRKIDYSSLKVKTRQLTDICIELTGSEFNGWINSLPNELSIYLEGDEEKIFSLNKELREIINKQ